MRPLRLGECFRGREPVHQPDDHTGAAVPDHTVAAVQLRVCGWGPYTREASVWRQLRQSNICLVHHCTNSMLLRQRRADRHAAGAIQADKAAPFL